MQPQPPDASRAPGPVPGWQAPGLEPDPPPVRRPVLLTGAAVVLIVLGALVGLLGLLFLLVGATFGSIISMPEFQDRFGDVSPSAGGVFVVFGLLFLADGVLQLLSGIFVLPGRSWARIAGMITGVLGALIALVGVLPAQGGGGGFNLFFVILLAGYVYVVWVLATEGGWFRSYA
jgi:hypothetical protein